MGWDRSKASFRSQTHASPSWWDATSDSSRSRTGSASAFTSGTICSACVAESGSWSRASSTRPTRRASAPAKTSTCVNIDIHLCPGQPGRAYIDCHLYLRSASCLVSSSPSTSTISTSPSTSTAGSSHRACQGPPRLRELRHRRATAEARAHREPRAGRLAQPPGRRGRKRRYRGRDPDPARRGRAGVRGRARHDLLLRQAGQVLGRGHADGEAWEIYTVLADSPTPNGGPAESTCCTSDLGGASRGQQAAASTCC